MSLVVDGIHLHVRREGAGPALVFLHGWGASGDSFEGLVRALRDRWECVVFDLPGFGRSAPPPRAWGSEEAALLIGRALDQLEVAPVALIGHSFGGKVALRLAAEGRGRKLVLFGSAGIPPRRPPSYYLKVHTFKTLKLLARIPGFRPLFGDVAERMRSRTGSADYRAASGVMRDSLVRSVNEDLRPLLPKVPCPTLLVWGRDDTATPPADGEAMRAAIPDAGLVILEQAGHYVFLDQPARALAAVQAFLAPAEGGHA